MSVTTCFSSDGMHSLLKWRNPHKEERNWLDKPSQPINNPLITDCKKVCTELALVGLVVTSVVETVGYVALTAFSLFLKPVSNKPFEKCVKLLDSSFFTFTWAIVDLYFNINHPNLITQESIARMGHDWKYQDRPHRWYFIRDEDIKFFNAYFPNSYLNPEQRVFMGNQHNIPPVANSHHIPH